MPASSQPVAVIVGAGPAGLTAGLELIRCGVARPVLVEADVQVGGISKTVNHNGWRMDLGGHRFFSKSDRIMDWWTEIMPVAGAPASDDLALGRELPLEPGGPDPEQDELVMLVRERLSRIYYNRHLFDYPIKPSIETVRKLGVATTLRIGIDYLRAAVWPTKPEETLEDFLVNRFGRTLYEVFFKYYTEKVWGIDCARIDASWGRQRIKGLSVMKALMAALKPKSGDIAQKDQETTLINRFLYPKRGPGQLWEEVARRIEAGGGEIRMRSRVKRIFTDAGRCTGVELEDGNGQTEILGAGHVISTMPIKDLAEALDPGLPAEADRIARELPYRDYMTLGVLVDDLEMPPMQDNWIYIQDRGFNMGRIQFYNNWSPYLVQDTRFMWLGLEFFCQEGDAFWTMPDEDFRAMSVAELQGLGVVRDPGWVRDSRLIRVKKAYPAYWGSFKRFDELRPHLDDLVNLYCIGRNGTHRYNNMDHSMLTAMEAVRLIRTGEKDKDGLWSLNTEQEYHEARKEQT